MDTSPFTSAFTMLMFSVLSLAPLVLVVGLPVWGLVDALRTPDERWQEVRHTRALWILLMLALPVLGTVLYALVARPRLRSRLA
jgi:hypothetical protein